MKYNLSKDSVATFTNAYIKVTIKYIQHSLIFKIAFKRIYPYISNEESQIFARYLGVEVKSGEWTWRYDVRHKDAAAAVSFHSDRHLEVLSNIASPTLSGLW